MSAKKSDYGDTSNGSLYYSNTTGTSWTYDDICTEPITISTPIVYPTPYMGSYQEPNIKSNKKGDDDMRYLYEVILVNPENDTFYTDKVIARSETSALMKAYDNSGYGKTEFDDLKTSCRILIEWKKEKSLKKAIGTIKEAVE